MGFYGMVSFVNHIASIGWGYRRVVEKGWFHPIALLLLVLGPIGFITAVIVSFAHGTRWATWTPEKE